MDYKTFKPAKVAKRPVATRHSSYTDYPSDTEEKNDFPDNISQWSETESMVSTGRSSIAESHSTRTTVSFGGVDDYFGDEDQIEFPSYDDAAHTSRVVDLCDGVSALRSLSPLSPSGEPESSSPDPMDRAEDDVAIAEEPSRHVDYLSHDWTEQDIWSSYKHLRSKRKVYSKRERLENAAWRLWGKTRQQLGTVAPESINWSVVVARVTAWVTC